MWRVLWCWSKWLIPWKDYWLFYPLELKKKLNLIGLEDCFKLWQNLENNSKITLCSFWQWMHSCQAMMLIPVNNKVLPLNILCTKIQNSASKYPFYKIHQQFCTIISMSDIHILFQYYSPANNEHIILSLKFSQLTFT